MTTDPNDFIARQRAVREAISAGTVRLLELASNDPAVDLTEPSGAGSAEGGAREPNPATPPLLAAIADARAAGDMARLVKLNGQHLRAIAAANDTGGDPDLDHLPPAA